MRSSHAGTCRSDKTASLSARRPYSGTTILYHTTLLSSERISASPFFLSSFFLLLSSVTMTLDRSLTQHRHQLLKNICANPGSGSLTYNQDHFDTHTQSQPSNVLQRTLNLVSRPSHVVNAEFPSISISCHEQELERYALNNNLDLTERTGRILVILVRPETFRYIYVSSQKSHINRRDGRAV
jgi:hypothetical protein